MKICVAQIKSVKGDVASNINNHKKLIELAADEGAGIIIFPELSLTGYESVLAKALATNQDDKRFDDFQQISNNKNIIIGVGMPTRSSSGILISMIIFQPGIARQTYSKQHLHSDELPYYTNGQQQTFLELDQQKIALAICYELTIPGHSENAHMCGSKIYIASVAKTASGVAKAFEILSGIAAKYSMTVLLSNCTGEADGELCGGKSAAWNDKGLLMGNLNETDDGILIFDTDTQEVIQKTLALQIKQ